MITPNDISSADFSRSFRGFDVNEVRDFLTELSENTLQLLKKNNELKTANADLIERLEQLKSEKAELEEKFAPISVLAGYAVKPNELSEMSGDELVRKNEELVKQNRDLDIEIAQKEIRLEEIRLEGAKMLNEIKTLLHRHMDICDSLGRD